jgi:bifunctional pyridoxal-dependent enzyme with beta-cystathionase and maltose regulon repressor activities
MTDGGAPLDAVTEEALRAAGQGHVRLNLATPRPLLRTIVERMAASLA